MEGMESMESSNDIQLVTNQEGQFAGYTKKRKNNVDSAYVDKKTAKFATKKKEDEMPSDVKKLFNLD